ncbi:MAG: patatin-like phospholipase family protein [Pirellula sp.]
MNQNNKSWWDPLVAKRFGYLMAVSLLTWPLLTKIPALKSILQNVMLLDTYPQLAFFTFTNVVAFFFSTAILRVLYSRHPSNTFLHQTIGDGAARWGAMRVWRVTLIALITPILLATAFGSEFEAPKLELLSSLPVNLSAILCVCFSAVVAVAFLWLLGRIKGLLFGSRSGNANFFPFESFDCEGLDSLSKLTHWVSSMVSRIGLSTTDVQLAIYLGLLATLHRFLLPTIEGDRYILSSAPSAIVLLLWIFGMGLSGMAYLLDRLRIPVIVAAVLLLTCLFAIVGSTRPFRLIPRVASSPSAAPADPQHPEEPQGDDIQWRAIKARMDALTVDPGNRKGKTLVVVTCPGGGIHAAAWAACVLDKLCDEYEEFQESLCIISGVSGGSVGTLFFVGSRYEDKLRGHALLKSTLPTADEISDALQAESRALELASRSSLEAISFGATVDDLYGIFGFSRIDRGERLERQFSGRLDERLQELTLADWGDRAIKGLVPIVVFNATDAVSGRRILFDSIPTPTPAWEPTRKAKARPFNYRDLFDTKSNEIDVLPATAARISATFPYVSPFVRPDKPNHVGQRVALCDGGYVDNEGIVTAITWIDHLLGYWYQETEALKSIPNTQPNSKKSRTFDRILLLRIEPAVTTDKELGQQSLDPFAYVRWLIGPMEAMMNVRSTSQLERGHLEADLVEVYLDASNGQSDESNSPRQDTELRKRWFDGSRRPADLRSTRSAQETAAAASSRQQVREKWAEDLMKMETRFRSKKSGANKDKSTSGSLSTKAVVVDKHQNAPVIIESIRFQDAGQEIPLSWKLSKQQKLWYLLSWEKLDELNPNLRPTLNRYFTRRPSADSDPGMP